MSINKYNFLEHPEIISTDEGRIELTYDALGNKLQKRVYAEGFNPDNYPNSCATEALMNQQDYLLDFLYRWYYPETDDNGAPKFRAHRFYHEEGSIEWRRVGGSNGNSQTAWKPTYQYTIRDHLGNGRVYFTEDYNGDGLPDILQESHYYPFGQQIEGLSKLYDPPGDVFFSQNGYLYPEDPATGNTTFIEYRQYTHDLKRYNDKEFNRELGLNWYDYGARWYDPVIGRWNAVDPLAEKYYSINSYVYVANNPTLLIDPDGREIKICEGSGDEKKCITYTPGMEAPKGADNFLKSVINSLNFLHQKGHGKATEIIDFLSGYGETTVSYHSYSRHNSNTSEIGWNDEKGGITNAKNKKTGSNRRPPASILFHELVHSHLKHKALKLERETYAKIESGELIKGTNAYKKAMKAVDQAWTDYKGNEDNVINNYETPMNKEAGWGIRKKKGGESPHKVGTIGDYRATCPTCTTGPEKKDEDFK